jgi:uncharacterized protein YcfL
MTMATIKKLVLLSLTALIIVGCNQSTENREAPLGGNILTTSYQTVIVDSCEYILGASKIAHKGNCHFCKDRDSIKWEKRKKELEELLIKLKEK